MAKNPGKIFEEDFKSSISDEDFLVHRLKDSAQAYNNSSKTSFTWNNPCDFLVYSPASKNLFALELKTTKYKSFTYDDPYSEEKESKMVKRHQIKSLKKWSKYDGVYPAFVFNFRSEKGDRTYVQHINDFMKMLVSINGKKSFNEFDIINNNGIKIDGEKKRTRYRWDFESFFDSFIQ